MGHPRIRVYFGPEESTKTSVLGSESANHHRVTVPFREICELLADAVKNRRAWLQDFEDDEVTISADLYDVLMAYEHYRCPPA